MLILISGGVRSNKSLFAESLIESDKVYIATMKFFDKETLKRIKSHKARRNNDWISYEVYQNLVYKEEYAGKEILLDCLTNLVTNELLDNVQIDVIIKNSFKEILKINNNAKKLIIVTNNVFEEIGNYSELTKDFLKTIGKLTTKIAKEANFVYDCEAGICLMIKGEINEKIN